MMTTLSSSVTIMVLTVMMTALSSSVIIMVIMMRVYSESVVELVVCGALQIYYRLPLMQRTLVAAFVTAASSFAY